MKSIVSQISAFIGHPAHRMGYCGLIWLVSIGVSGAQPPNMPPAPVVVAPVVERTIAGAQSFVGTVVPRYTAVIGTAVAGRIVDIFVEEGDQVTARQPLAKLLTETIELEIVAAKAELDLRQQELLELTNGTRPEELRQIQRASGPPQRAGSMKLSASNVSPNFIPNNKRRPPRSAMKQSPRPKPPLKTTKKPRPPWNWPSREPVPNR